jgi:hypothetical protein
MLRGPREMSVHVFARRIFATPEHVNSSLWSIEFV